MSTDKEFKIVERHLEDLGLNDGDIGYAFWYKVSKYFKELRKNDIDASA